MSLSPSSPDIAPLSEKRHDYSSNLALCEDLSKTGSCCRPGGLDDKDGVKKHSEL